MTAEISRGAASWIAATLISIAGLVGCDESVSLNNLPGYVTFVGPQAVSDGGIATWFGVSDLEGDLVSVTVEVCVEQECFVPELLPGSATVETLPTSGDERAAALRVIWRPECDLIDPNTPFTVHIQALGADAEDGVMGLSTSPVTLDELGYRCEAE